MIDAMSIRSNAREFCNRRVRSGASFVWSMVSRHCRKHGERALAVSIIIDRTLDVPLILLQAGVLTVDIKSSGADMGTEA